MKCFFKGKPDCLAHSEAAVKVWFIPLVCLLLAGLPWPGQTARAQSGAAPPGLVAERHTDWLARARELERSGDWSGLLDWGLRWSQVEADEPLAWFVLGRAYRGLGRLPEAILAYQHALRLDPEDVHARTNLGNAYRDSRRYRDALLTYREAVRANPHDLPAWRRFGQTYYLMKGEAGVVDALQRVRQVNPRLAAAWYSLMVEYYRTRNDAAGRDALELLRGLKPEEVDRLFAIILGPAG